MPTYAYVCKNCHHEFDAFQGIRARPLRECPACGQATLRRLIGSGAGILFKGSGFYCTDYRSEGYKTAVKTEAGGTKSKVPDKKSETKPSEGVSKQPSSKDP
jgi:putative FmdB family regulatory protein